MPDGTPDMTARAWQPGDRVYVRLPDRFGVAGRMNSMHWFPGTVRNIDTSSRPGVLVDLDIPVNDVPDCYTTHAELRPRGEQS